jgi:hypothetical protein
MIYVAGNNNASDVAVTQSGSNLVVKDFTNNFTRSFAASQVQRLQFVGGAGNDRLFDYVSWLPIQAWGYGGNDLLQGANGNDILVGGAGNDTLIGNGGNDQILGGDANDTLYGSDGNDSLYGEGGNDQILGGNGNDTLYGGEGNDSLSGEGGNDRLFGEGGADQLRGSDGNDWLDSGSTGEVLDGGNGTDWNARVWVINGVSPGDVLQRGAPTCSFMASLVSCVQGGLNLASRISYLGNFQYNVPLFNGRVWTNQVVTFDGSTNKYDPQPATEGESWVILYQRAYIQMLGNDGSGWPNTALTALTGRATTSLNYAPRDAEFYTVEAALRQGRFVVTATYPNNPNQSPLLVNQHAYTVVSVSRNAAGQPGSVVVRNPWGYDGGRQVVGNAGDGYVTLTWAQFKASMEGLWIN